MDIIITSLNKLPDTCDACPCYDGYTCKADKQNRGSQWRPFWCPLKEGEKKISPPKFNSK